MRRTWRDEELSAVDWQRYEQELAASTERHPSMRCACFGGVDDVPDVQSES